MQPNNFAILTAAIRFSKKLTDRQKLLCAEISALSNRHGYCYASNQFLGDLYNRAAETISRDIKAIEAAGFIRCEYMEDNTRHIYLLTERSRPIDETVKTPIDETVKHNNISINNINRIKEQPSFLNVIEYYLERFPALVTTPNQGRHRKYIDELIGRKISLNDFKKVIDHQAQKYQDGKLETYVVLPNCLFKPENFENTLAIINNPKPKQARNKLIDRDYSDVTSL